MREIQGRTRQPLASVNLQLNRRDSHINQTKLDNLFFLSVMNLGKVTNVQSHLFDMTACGIISFQESQDENF